MYNEEKLYSVWSFVVVHIVNFQRDLVVVWFMYIEDVKYNLFLYPLNSMYFA